MSRLTLAIITMFAILGYQQNKERWFSLKRIPEKVAFNLKCEGKKQCLLVYVAPWCSACHQMTPSFQEFQNLSRQNPDVGIKIIVGAGRSVEENNQMAKNFIESIVDHDLVIRDQLKVSYYPSIYLANDAGEIQLRDQAAMLKARDLLVRR
jgi:thiol-disulfide isomerase/thioredoxin